MISALMSLHFWGLIVALLALANGFRREGSRGWLLGVLGGLLVAVISIFTAGINLADSMELFFWDFTIIALSGMAFLFFARFKRLFWAIVGIMAVVAGLMHKFKIRPLFHDGAEISFIQGGIALDEAGELLVELSPHTSPQDIASITQKFDLNWTRAFHPSNENNTDLDDYYIVDISDEHAMHIVEVIDALRGQRNVDWIEENEIITLDDPQDVSTTPLPFPLEDYDIDDPDLAQLWGFTSLGMSDLYRYMKNENIEPVRRALIAILDTGIDSKHEDLSDRYVTTDEKSDNDPRGHGTHCAGIAAAVTNNGKGIASYALTENFVAVTSIKVLSAGGIGTQKTIIDGIIKAADAGADVISMSLGGRSTTSKQRAYEQAVEYAHKKGAIVIAAAGNSNRNARNFAPVSAPGVIGVAAIDRDASRAVFSNTVEDIKWGVAAPGVNVYSTLPNDSYGEHSGTSMATPYVAGLVGLMKSLRPDLTAEKAYKVLNETGRQTLDTEKTGRLIQPRAAVEALRKMK